MDETFVVEVTPGQMVSTAVHAGHELRAGLVDLIALDPATRLREEDPFTDRMLGDAGSVSSSAGHGSRLTSTGRESSRYTAYLTRRSA